MAGKKASGKGKQKKKVDSDEDDIEDDTEDDDEVVPTKMKAAAGKRAAVLRFTPS